MKLFRKTKDDVTVNSNPPKRPAAVKVISIVVAAVLLAGLISGGSYFAYMSLPTSSVSELPEELRGISPISAVSATDYSGDKITQNTQFKITTDSAMSKDEFMDVFSILPRTGYSLTKNSGNTFTVSFPSGLKPDTLYSLKSCHDGKAVYSWAFQTDSSFSVVSHSPDSDYADSNSSVEIEFSSPDVQNFEECFSIYPSVPGTIEHYSKRWVFVPSVEFEKNTMYTVTISSDISCKGARLDSNYTFSFVCTDSDSYIRMSRSDLNPVDCFAQTEIPRAAFEYSGMKLSKTQVSVFSINSAQTYSDILKNMVYGVYVSSKIEEILTQSEAKLNFEAQPISQGTEPKTAAFDYPGALEAGYYVSKINFGDTVLYHVFQVSNLAVYTVGSGSDLSIWVNSIETKDSVAQASVKIGEYNEVLTSQDGLAVLNGIESDGAALPISVTSEGTLQYISLINTPQVSERAASALSYSSYLRCDRKIYSPNDTVNVWGFILPQNDDVSTPENLQLYCEWNDSYTDITADAMGGFCTEMPLCVAGSDLYTSVALYGDGMLITEARIYISDCSLPAYTAKISTDKNAYLTGEEIEYTVRLSTSDGAPAGGVTIETSFNGKESKKLTTDETGVAKLYKDAVYNAYTGDNCVPCSLNAGFTVIQPDGTAYYRDINVPVFDSDITSVISQSRSDIEISLYSVDLSRINSAPYGSLDCYDSKSFIGSVFESDLQIELHKVSYRKVTGENDYEQNDETLSVGSVSTENGSVSLALSEVSDAFSSYYYLITVYREDEPSVSIRYDIFTSSFSGDDSGYNYSLYSEKTQYTAQDSMSLKLVNNSEQLPVSDGTLFLSSVNCDIVGNDIFENPSDIKMQYKAGCSPEFKLVGAYFDGTCVYPVQSLTLKSCEDPLNVSVSTDKAQYEPGDTVKLSISVTDSSGGGVKAEVNVSAVNCMTSFPELQADSIYDDVNFSRSALSQIKSSISAPQPLSVSGIPQTEYSGNDGYSDYDFETSACFKTIITDNYGKATVEFTLPQSADSWSVNVRAFSANAGVGQSALTVAALKELAVSTYEHAQIKSGEDAVFPINITSIDGNTQCQYVLELLQGGKLLSTESALSDTNTFVTKNFGKLENGIYSLRVSVKSGSTRDVFETDFTVEDSFESVSATTRKALDEGTAPDTDFTDDVVLTICDEEYDFYYTVADAVHGFDSAAPGNEISKLAAGGIILSGNLTALDSLQLVGIDKALKETGYFSGGAGIGRAAQVTAAFGQYLDHKTQVDYFYSVLYSSPTTVQSLYALWGLAATGQPVLDDLNAIKSDIDSLSDEETICLALSYAYAGDYGTAADIYNEKISVTVKTANGISKIVADNEYGSENLTELCAALTVKFSTTQAKPLIKGVLSSGDLTCSQSTVLAGFLNNYVLYQSGENSVIMTAADGSTQSIEYPKYGFYRQVIAKDELGKVSFAPENGESIIIMSGTKASTLSNTAQ